MGEEKSKPSRLISLEPHQTQSPAIAVFGGSFNPIHLGHLRIAKELIDLYGFTKVIFVPNGGHYRKKGLIGEEHRAKMVELAIAREPAFQLCRFELDRKKVIYTLEALKHLQQELAKEHPAFELFNVRGSDNIRKMLRWKTAPALLKTLQIVPIRPNADPVAEFANDDRFRAHYASFRIMHREYEDGLSSSLVRKRVRQTRSTRFLVPEEVDGYIRSMRLYEQER